MQCIFYYCLHLEISQRTQSVTFELCFYNVLYLTKISYYKSSSVCLSVCLSVCSLSPPRSFDRSSPNLVGVCRWTSELPLRGSFSKRSTGRWVQRVTFTFHYIIYVPASLHTAAKGGFAATASNQTKRHLLLH